MRSAQCVVAAVLVTGALAAISSTSEAGVVFVSRESEVGWDTQTQGSDEKTFSGLGTFDDSISIDLGPSGGFESRGSASQNTTVGVSSSGTLDASGGLSATSEGLTTVSPLRVLFRVTDADEPFSLTGSARATRVIPLTCS